MVRKGDRATRLMALSKATHYGCHTCFQGSRQKPWIPLIVLIICFSKDVLCNEGNKAAVFWCIDRVKCQCLKGKIKRNKETQRQENVEEKRLKRKTRSFQLSTAVTTPSTEHSHSVRI